MLLLQLYTNFEVFTNLRGELYTINNEHYYGVKNWKSYISVF